MCVCVREGEEEEENEVCVCVGGRERGGVNECAARRVEASMARFHFTYTKIQHSKT